jgi:HEPN domain-containing protein
MKACLAAIAAVASHLPSDDMTAFAWPHYPRTDAEFEALMAAVDSALAAESVTLVNRTMHVGFKFWEAFKWAGQVFPDRALADTPGFQGDVLMAKAIRWYETTYADRLKVRMGYGSAPAQLGNALWRVHAGRTYGTVTHFIDRDLRNHGRALAIGGQGPATYNILRAVEGLPQGLVERLSERVLQQFGEFYFLMHRALQWREKLPQTDLLRTARDDYEESTAGVLGGTYGQARWAAQQACEKTLKGLLTFGGTKFATSGQKGHSLAHAASRLKVHHGIGIDPKVLALAECASAVRYGKEVSSETQALLANHAVLAVLDCLRRSSPAAELLANHR